MRAADIQSQLVMTLPKRELLRFPGAGKVGTQMLQTPPPPSPFGEQLRFWRRRHGLSQLELAVRAGTTPRHVSFIETGRSRPGRELVLRLGAAMDLPVRDRNALLQAAGFGPAFSEHGLNDDEMRPFRMAVEAILKRHDPYPACAMDPLGRMRMANAGFHRLFPGIAELTPEQALDAFFAPGPGREMVENWAEAAWAYADRLRREAQRDPRLAPLAQRALKHLEGTERPLAAHAGEGAIIGIDFNFGGKVIRTFGTVMRFDKPNDVTLSELRVELIFPMDAEADAFFRSLAAQ